MQLFQGPRIYAIQADRQQHAHGVWLVTCKRKRSTKNEEQTLEIHFLLLLTLASIHANHNVCVKPLSLTSFLAPKE